MVGNVCVLKMIQNGWESDTIRTDKKRAASIMLTAQHMIENKKGHPARDGQYMRFYFNLI
jgi:hypothetical protein